MRQFLTDFDEPRRFLEIEDFKDLDSEPCGELDVSIQQIGAGGDSKFLPEVSTYVSILYIMINWTVVKFAVLDNRQEYHITSYNIIP